MHKGADGKKRLVAIIGRNDSFGGASLNKIAVSNNFTVTWVAQSSGITNPVCFVNDCFFFTIDIGLPRGDRGWR